MESRFLQKGARSRCIPTYLARRCPHHLASLASRPKCVVSIEDASATVPSVPFVRSPSARLPSRLILTLLRAPKSILTSPYLTGYCLADCDPIPVVSTLPSLHHHSPLHSPPPSPSLTARSKKISCTHCSSGVLTGDYRVVAICFKRVDNTDLLQTFKIPAPK